MKYKILIEESKENQILIKNALSGRKSEGKRKKVVAGFLSLSMQHHHSISLLVENKLYSSAFALLHSSNSNLGMILLAFGDVEKDELLINLAHKIIKEE